MIIYLGMPRCASSWLFNTVSQRVGYEGEKEPHSLYTSGTLTNTVLDFSTNNWSMDSDVARSIDSLVSHYIFIFRDPLELARSYYTLLESEQDFSEFYETLIIQKLLCYGDILERWCKNIDISKLLVYNYNNHIVGRQREFMGNICSELGLEPLYVDEVLNASKRKTYDTPSRNLLDITDEQMRKYNDIAENKNLWKM